MFYEGDLQTGISKAVQESKLVACFVTDEGEESELWEDDFLQESALKSLLAEQTVLLRLKAGSVEAGHLAAIFPLPKGPTLVVIKNGELKEYLAAGVSKEDFSRRLKVALGVSSNPPTSTNETPLVPGSTVPAQGRVYPARPIPAPSSSQQPRDPSPPIEPPQPSVLQSMPDRNARLEAQRKELEAHEKAKRAAEAKARKEKAEASAPSGSKASADMKYAQMQKKRQQDARDERARILKRVEDDKAERREREANRKAEAQALAEGAAPQWAPQTDVKPLPSKFSAECAIQVRLFDGSTIRSRFPSQGNLIKDVRPWIDAKQEGDTPYIFKHVLTPLPNKNIEMSEEESSLHSLGLSPSATLILVPVTDFTSAYEGNGGILSRGVSTGYGLVSSGLGMVTGVLGSFLGSGATQETQERQDSNPAPTAAPGASVNVRTLRDQQDKRDDQQFYNGNALNFEPRKDDEGKKDD